MAPIGVTVTAVTPPYGRGVSYGLPRRRIPNVQRVVVGPGDHMPTIGSNSTASTDSYRRSVILVCPVVRFKREAFYTSGL